MKAKRFFLLFTLLMHITQMAFCILGIKYCILGFQATNDNIFYLYDMFALSLVAIGYTFGSIGRFIKWASE